ncbi:winged helix-turn-helix domain-containing protein [uncultured Bacteroides sp.]|uniref:winged helix-turn-helix domain-containing protein n=1 Tax=uncultured Bacteroides sp. TaxID=162156 RepID=UPI002627E822|nr:winged helix-turn-helix domain-containing protein [uncultured Bacteroides sp.]
MDKYQIGTNAGIVWNVLKDNNHWEYGELKAATGLSDRELNAAIGWLAREDKIDFEMDPVHDKLFLSVNVYIG